MCKHAAFFLQLGSMLSGVIRQELEKFVIALSLESACFYNVASASDMSRILAKKS